MTRVGLFLFLIPFKVLCAGGFEVLWYYVVVEKIYAEVAHLVERDLAKVEVAGSSPVFRSERIVPTKSGFFFDTRVVELVDTQDLKSCGQ